MRPPNTPAQTRLRRTFWTPARRCTSHLAANDRFRRVVELVTVAPAASEGEDGCNRGGAHEIQRANAGNAVAI